MLHNVSDLTNLTKGGNESKTDNNQGEFGLFCFSGKTFGVMNDHAIYSMQISTSNIRQQVKKTCILVITGSVKAVFNKAALLMYAVYLQVHPTTYNEELSLLTVHKRTNMAPK